MNSGSRSQADDLRMIRYRIKRLGMLELEAWLVRLEPALVEGDDSMVRAALHLLDMDTPELLAIMHGERPLPEALRPWLID